MAAALSVHHLALGRTLRELREERGLSQEELAWRSDLHRNYVGRVERGELNLSFARLVRLASTLEVPLSAVVSRYEELI